MLELETIGPFSWLSSCDDAPPRVFDSPASNKCGVYLFTVPTAESHLIYWVGQTSQPVRTRLATHSREFLAGTYNILDMAELREVIFPRFRGQSDYAANAFTCVLNSNSTGLR